MRYYIRRDVDGSVCQISRIIEDESGLWGQYWQDGEWFEHRAVTDYLLDCWSIRSDLARRHDPGSEALKLHEATLLEWRREFDLNPKDFRA